VFSVIGRRVTVGNVVLVVVLVFALSGGAFAAGKFLITSTKQIKPSVLAQLKGKAGKAGVAGPVGGVGPQGPVGGVGAKGDMGPGGPEGKEGQAGKDGKDGLEGSPWTVGGVLPSGKTLVGEWGVNVDEASGAFIHAFDAVSFGIPLASVPAAHYIREDGKEPFYDEATKKEGEREQPACPGNVESPKALSGNLCVYASYEENVVKEPFPGIILPRICSLAKVPAGGGGGACLDTGGVGVADRYGFDVNALSQETGAMQAVGTWAVTAK
jgi:hypothetical protein